MALAMKALPGLQAKLAGSRVTAARQNCSIRRLPVQQRIVSVATASADAPQTDAEKEQILKEIEQVNAELTAAGVESEFLAVWDDEADEAEEGEAEIVDINDPRLADADIGDEDYEGPEAIVQTLYNDDTETFMGTEVLYDFDGELVKDSPEAEAFLKEEYPSWFADAEEVVEETENAADEEDEEGEADYDEGEMDETDLAEREELMSAMEKRDEALTLLKSWTPEMLEELYPNGKVPGFNKKQSKDLWRALRYFLAVEAVDAAYEVQNLGAEGGDVVELDDDNDFEEEDADEDTAADVALYEEYDALAREFDIAVNPKDRVYGTVYRVTEDGAYVELPGKCSGYVPLSECSVAKLSSPTEVLVVGTKREFVVLEVDDVYGEVILSLRAMEWDVLWRRVQQLQEEDVTVYVTVTDFNNGGLTVDYQGIEGFIPIAQFGNKLQLETMEELVGVQVPCKIFEASQEDERIVFSNKRAISDGYSQTFNPGDVLSGVIQSVKTYGAFVDLGGVTGLLHISQISNDRVMDVSKVFSEGDKLKVMVLSTDKDRGRVTLSTKKLEATPGDMIRAPDLVYEKAEEIAAQFKERMGAANDLSGNPAEFDPAYDTMGSVVQGYAGNTGYEYQEGYDYQAAGQQVAGEEQPPQDAQQ